MRKADLWEVGADQRERLADEREALGDEREALAALQRDPAVRQSGADLHDRAAVAWQHADQRRPGAIDIAQIRHLGRAAKLVWIDLGKRREHR
jgi:hypothetical protein